jgi:hypothetical protein
MKLRDKKRRSKMKILTAIIINIIILLSASHSAKAFTYDFDTLAPSLTAKADFGYVFSTHDAIFANLDDRMYCAKIMKGHWGKNGRFFHMLSDRVSDLDFEMAILTPPRNLMVYPIAPIGHDAAGMGLDGPGHELPGLNWNRPTTNDNPTPTPEPATLLLLGSGLLGLGWSGRRVSKAS